MTMYSGVLLLLLCAISFSGLDVCRKKLAAEYSTFRILTLVMGAQIPCYAIWYFLSPGPAVNLAAYAPWGFTDAVLNFAANILIVLSLALSPLSNAIPLLALTPTFSLMFQPLFALPVSTVQIMGGIVIFCGALVLNGVPNFHARKEKGLFYMLLAAVTCGIIIHFDKQSLRFAPIPFHGLVQTTGMTTFSLAAERIFRIPARELNMRLSQAPWKLWIGASLFAFLAGISQLGSLGYFDPGVVEAVKRALVLFMSVTFGFLFFREPLTLRKILGVFFMALGIVLTSRR